MIIGPRLRFLREQKALSQGDIENRTGLLRCYVSRVENGHTIPSVETLEKLARGLEMPLYQVLYDGDEPPSPLAGNNEGVKDWAAQGMGARFLSNSRSAFPNESERPGCAHVRRIPHGQSRTDENRQIAPS